MTVSNLLPADGRSAPGATTPRLPAREPFQSDLPKSMCSLPVSRCERSEPHDAPRQGTSPTGGGNSADLPPPVAFTLPTPPSVNELYKNVRGVGRVKAGLYDDFIRRGVASIRTQRVAMVPGYVVAVFGVERMSITADIDNRLKSMLDTIVKAGVIEDDRFVTAIAVSWLPRANGLAHIRLFPVQQLDLTFHPSNNGSAGGWYLNEPFNQGDEDGNLAI